MSILQRLPSNTLRRYLGPSVCSACSCRSYSKKIFQENDIVLLKHKTNPAAVLVLTHCLHAGNKIELVRDSIFHDAILGKGVRDLVSTRKRVSYRLLEPTLAEYTDLSPRIVTPIYSQDANLIVSLLDLHPTVPGSSSLNEDRFEIFEAGTGHGALTLNLARAIHGANTVAPEIPDESEVDLQVPDAVEAKKQAYKKWRTDRRAVIHTLDCSGRHSAHAKTVIKNFRRGMYYPHIDFHVGSIDKYLSSRLLDTGDAPFLEHAILDLPNTHGYFDLVGKALKLNGSLITFCPSITQINAGVMFVRQNNLPLFLEKVVEVGAAVGVGGREWDVRPVKPRALLKAQAEEVKQPEILEGNEDVSGAAVEKFEAIATEASTGEASITRTPAPNGGGWEMICRPKVGIRISGGGFVGLWRRMTDSSE